MNEKKSPVDVYAIVNKRIIKRLEKGIIPWQQPMGEAGLPKNIITGRLYKGINVWLLASLGYEQNYFLSAKQIKEMGATIKEGQKGNLIVFWKWLEIKDDETDQSANIPFLRYSNVYNIAQCDGISETQIPLMDDKQINPLKKCLEIVVQMPNLPKIKHKEDKAFYNPLLDFINVPKEQSFKDKESYYSILFRELIHSTGHLSRLNRKEVVQQKAFGADPYSIEELTSEIGSSYMKSFAGIGKEYYEINEGDNEGWIDKIQNDKRFIIYASTLAQKATDFILNMSFQTVEIGNSTETKPEEIQEESEDDLPF